MYENSIHEEWAEGLQSLPADIQALADKQFEFLIRIGITHNSLHAKKYSETDDCWQARLSRDWRFYFFIIGDTYLIHEIKKHPK
jgi:hypothetical protein